MKILVLNCGSSSVKFKLFNEKYNLFCSGIVEKIGENISYFEYQIGDRKINKKIKVVNHDVALKLAIQYLTDKDWGVVEDINEIKAVGHRVVHGGDIARSILIDTRVIKKIKKFAKLAPLHNPHNLKGIEIARKIFFQAKHVAVFDTAFHQTMPKKAFIYGLPYQLYQKHQIRRYGFHGTSHQYIAQRAAKIIRKPISRLKIITCHLGAGSSITAIDNGSSVDTSMGFTPLEGLMMATRTGDFDPAIIFYLQSELKMKNSEIEDMINNQGGVLGVSGKSQDMRVILKNRTNDPKCKLALEIYCYRVTKYIGAYLGALGKLDVLVFTGGIGENSPVVRSLICENLNNLGIKLDLKLNKKAVGKEQVVSVSSGKIKVLAIPTDEEKMIAMEAATII